MAQLSLSDVEDLIDSGAYSGDVTLSNEAAVLALCATVWLKETFHWSKNDTVEPLDSDDKERIRDLVDMLTEGVLSAGSVPIGVPLGTVIMTVYQSNPPGYVVCNGQEFSKDVYPAYWAIVLDEYKTGEDTFVVPDMRGNVPLGAGNVPSGPTYDPNDFGGERDHCLTIDEIPEHVHEIQHKNNSGSEDGFRILWTCATPNTHPTLPAGGNETHNNIQPYNAVEFKIKLYDV